MKQITNRLRCHSQNGLKKVSSRLFSSKVVLIPTQTSGTFRVAVGAAGLGLAMWSLWQDPAHLESAAAQDDPTKLDSWESSPKKGKKKRRRGGKGPLPNPGKFYHYNLETRELFNPEAFGGARAEVNVPLMQTPQKTFLVGFVTALPTPEEGQPATPTTDFIAQTEGGGRSIMAQLSPTGRVAGRFSTGLAQNNKVVFRSSFMVQEKGAQNPNNAELSLDYKGADFYGHSKYSWAGGHGFGLSYLQSITPTMALGAECLHQLNMGTAPSMVYKYKSRTWDNDKDGDTITAALRMQGLEVTYARKIHQHVLVGAEFQVEQPPAFYGDPRPVSLTSVGVAYRYNTFNLLALLDSRGKVSCHYQQMVPQTPFSVIFHGEINPFTAASKFGIAFRFLQ